MLCGWGVEAEAVCKGEELKQAPVSLQGYAFFKIRYLSLNPAKTAGYPVFKLFKIVMPLGFSFMYIVAKKKF